MALTAFELIGTVEVKLGQSEQNLKRVDTASQRLHTQFKKPLPDPFRNVKAQASQAEAAISRVDAKMRSVQKSSGGGGGLFGPLLGANLAATAVAGLTATLTTGGREVLNYSSKLEQAKISFETMLGSVDAANQHLKDLKQFALKTPFELEGLIDASRRLQALGFEAKEVIPVLTNVGNAVAAMGGNREVMDRVVLALSQIQAKGKVAAQEMNQLAEAGIPAWRLLSEELGKSRAETIKLAEEGKISSEFFLRAFKKFSEANYGGAMEKQSRTFQGAMSNMKEVLRETAATAFEPLYRKISEISVRIGDEMKKGKSTFESGMRAMMEGAGEIAGQAGVMAGVAFANSMVNAISNFSFNPVEIFKRFQPFHYGVIKGVTDAVAERSTAPNPTLSDMARMDRLLHTPASRFGDPFARFKNKSQTTTLPSGGGGRGGGGGRSAQRDILEGLKTTVVDLNAEYRKLDIALLGSAKSSTIAAEKEKVLSQIMASLGANTQLAISKIKDVDEAIDKAIGSLPKQAQAAARALTEEAIALAKRNEEYRLAGVYADKTQELFARFRNEIDDSRLGTDEYTKAIRELDQALAKEQLTLDKGTRAELEHQAALQRTLKLLRERLVFARQRERFVQQDRPSWIDLGRGSTFGGEPDTLERPRFATLDNQVMREEMARRTEELRRQMNALADDVTNMFDRATEALIKTPGRFVDKWKEAFREVGLGFADMLLQMSNDLMRSQVLRLLERITGTTGAPGSESSQTNASINPLGALTDQLLKKLGVLKPSAAPKSAAEAFANIHNQPLSTNSNVIAMSLGSATGGGTQSVVDAVRKRQRGTMPESGPPKEPRPTGQETRDRVVNKIDQATDEINSAVQNQTAQINAQIQASADRIVDGLTPRQQGFWRGLLGAALSAAAGAAAGAAVNSALGGGGNNSGGSGRRGSVGVVVRDPSTGEEISPPPVPNLRRAAGGIISGPGTETSDSIMGIDRRGVPTALVSRGEFVVNAQATRKNRAALELINKTGEMPRLGLGGFLKFTSPISHKSVRDVTMPITHQGFRNATMPVTNQGFRNATMPLASAQGRSIMSPYLFGNSGGGSGAPSLTRSTSSSGGTVNHNYHFTINAQGSDAAVSIKKSRRQIERQLAQSLRSVAA